MDISETDDLSIVGEEAHIVAREENGPRGISLLTLEQRNKYGNLILMCSIHHKIIDDAPETFTVEVLNNYKSIHEEWIKSNLSLDTKKQKEDEIYASYLDEFLRLADIENYNAWSSSLVSNDQPGILKENYDQLNELLRYIVSRIWFNRYPDLESSIHNFKNVLNDLLQIFAKDYEAKFDGKRLWVRKFYKLERWDEELCDEMYREYEYHVDLITDLTLELTRATNYIFDKVREYLLPNFRIEEGVLLITIGPFYGFSYKSYRTEYRQLERVAMPYPGLKKFMEIRESRDLNWGQGVNNNYFPRELF